MRNVKGSGPGGCPGRRAGLAALILVTLLQVWPFNGLLAQGIGPNEPWRIVTRPQATLVLATDGSLIGEIGRELRTNVSIRTLPRYVGQAFVSVEDQRFYQHNGVDLIGIAGALKDDIMGA